MNLVSVHELKRGDEVGYLCAVQVTEEDDCCSAKFLTPNSRLGSLI